MDKQSIIERITLRKASVSDIHFLEYWDTQQHVIDCDPKSDWNWKFELSRDPEWRDQLVAELNGQPIGFIQIIDPHKEESHYWGEVSEGKRAIDIWIGELKHLNKGYGTTMMREAIKRCFQVTDVTGILIDPLKSNVKAHRFYERLGFVFIEERDFEGDLCYVYELRREDDYNEVRRR